MMDLCPCKQDVCSLGSKLNRLWSLLLYSLEKLAGQYFFYPFPPFLSPTSIMELVIICPTYPCSNNLSHFTLWAISLQLTRKLPITFTCMHKHTLTLTFLWQRVSFLVHMYSSSLFNLHCIETPSAAIPHPLPPQMLWQFEAENPSGCSVPRMREFLLRLPLRKMGPAP